MKKISNLLSCTCGLIVAQSAVDAQERRTGQPEFAYAIESCSASTNRNKFNLPEFEHSCGSGSVLFDVYKTLETEISLSLGYSDANGFWDASSYQYFRINYLSETTATTEYYYHTEVSSSGGTCYFTDDNGFVSGTPGCGENYFDEYIPDGYDENKVCPVLETHAGPALSLSSEACYWDDDNFYFYSNIETRSELTNPYDTSALLSPAGFDYGDWSTAAPSASCSIGDKVSPPIRDYGASLTKARYRFKVIAPFGQQFEIKYLIWTHYDGEAPTSVEASIKGLGKGRWAYYPDEPLELLPPSKQKMTEGCPDFIGGTRTLETLCGEVLGGTCGMSCKKAPGGVQASLTEYGLTTAMDLGSEGFGHESGSLLLAGSARPPIPSPRQPASASPVRSRPLKSSRRPETCAR